MQKLNEILARRNVSEPPTQDAKPSVMQPKVIEAFWLRMTEIYGHKWTSSYGETDTDGTWAKCLADLSGDELKRGFRTCMTNGEPWPPSLPEFRAMCKPPQRENERIYRYSPDRMLPKKLTDAERETGRAHIAELKRQAKQA